MPIAEKKIKRDDARREIRLYFREISKIPLLTESQEKEIGSKIRAGDKAALQLLIQSNLRFVIKIARRYQGCGLPLLDLINEGNLGLIEAAQRFDPTRNVKFTSYAVWWIRQSILLALSNLAHPLKLPARLSMALHRVKKAVNQKNKELHRDPTLDEISNETGISPSELNSILQLGGHSTSFDQPIEEGSELKIGDTLEQTSIPSIEKTLASEYLSKHIHQALNGLNEAEKNILKQRFGLTGDTPCTLREIGKSMGVSRERIRQMESKALQKLRKADTGNRLETYWE